jgi:CHAT domain-containing protein
MTEFYRQWQQTGNKGHALRKVMLATKAAHPNPRNWAAFTLIGEVE